MSLPLILNDTKQLKKKRLYRSKKNQNQSPNKCDPRPVRNVKAPRNFNKFLDRDVWNIIAKATNSTKNRIGIEAINDKIHFVENPKELQEQVLIDINGNKINIADLFQSHDPLAGDSMKIKFKLIPVIDGFSLKKNSIEHQYKFIDRVNHENEINNNKNNDNKENFTSIEDIEDSTMKSDDITTITINSTIEETSVISDDTFESSFCDYAEFNNNVAASSSIIAGAKDDNASTPIKR